jgi:DNA-binding HxlR family transcriptional regulator
LVNLWILLKDTPESKYSLSPLGKELSKKLIELAHWWGSNQKQ